MKISRFWLMAQVATCCFVTLAPAQAESIPGGEDSFKALPSLAEMATAIDSPELKQPSITLPPVPTDASLATLEQELRSLSSSDFHFPVPTDVSTAQLPPPMTRPAPPPPAAGQPLFPNPEIIIQQQGAPNPAANIPSNPDILTPRVPVAPTRARAVPPPVGDFAISNINASFDMIDLGRGGQAIVPRLFLREAPAREVLAVLTRYAGMNLIFTDGLANAGTATPGTPPGGQVNPTQGQSTITLDIENETVQDVFNSVLMASGLKASRRGNTIFAGKSLMPSARNTITRTIRLNQAGAEAVASALASQGAEVNILFQENEEVQLAQNAPPRVIKKPPTLTPLTVQKPANDSSVLILEGLVVSTDPRTNSVTLVGEPRNVELATSMINQMDARRRQVAVNVKIVDINLNNIQDYDSSFSFGIGDSYFVQDSGTAIMRFGDTAPASQDIFNSATGRFSNPPITTNPFSDASTFVDFNDFTTIPGAGQGFIEITNPVNGLANIVEVQRAAEIFNRVPAISGNPFLTGVTDFTFGEPTIRTTTFTRDPDTGRITVQSDITRGERGSAEFGLPEYFQYPQKFQAEIFAQIRSGNAKILTDPTLIVQEGQGASVMLTERVVSGVNTQVDPESGVRTTTPEFTDVGLTLGITVDRIDDNGFISVTVNPTISAPGAQERFESGVGAVNTITLINKRELSSGLVRLRDAQTFILSGIISELQQSVSTKVPILGDLPVIGALFRSSQDRTDRSEVIILLTPKIIPDSTETQFGFRYTPDQATQEFLQQKGFPVQRVP